MLTRRRVSGALLAGAGALVTTIGAYLNWFDDHPAHDLPLERLYQAEVAAGTASSYWNSMALPLAVVGALGVLGAVLVSRFVLVLGWLIALATLVVWLIMQLTDDTLDAGLGDAQFGYWVSAAGALIMLIGIIVMGRAQPRSED